MKCEKCGKNEANFFYSANINGEKSQRSLCTDCAREEGFGGALDYSPSAMFEDMFSDFFSPMGSFFPSFGSFGSPLRRIISPAIPRVHLVIGESEAQTASESESRIPADAGEEVKKRRELEALKHKLSQAVEAEDFESAIQLRDQIRELEK